MTMERERLARAGQGTQIAPVGIEIREATRVPEPRRQLPEDQAGITTQDAVQAAQGGSGGGAAAIGLLAIAGISIFLLTRK